MLLAPGRRRRAVGVAAACLAVGGVVTTAQAVAPLAVFTSHSVVHAPAAAVLPTDLPTGPPGFTQNGLKVDKAQQDVAKAKVRFDLAPFTALAYTKAAVEQPPDPVHLWVDSISYVYVTSPPGSPNDFGYFPSKTVSVLAFGSIPVTATVHIRQLTQPDGSLEPLTVSVRFTGKPVAPPTPLPCSPPTTAVNQCFFTEAAHMIGHADVSIDDLRVDGVPVPVGTNCHTGTPATLDLHGLASYYSTATHPPYIPDGVYLPFVGGPLQGSVDVPDFTGCHNGADNLDALLDGMVAGPGNELLVHQDGPLGSYPPS